MTITDLIKAICMVGALISSILVIIWIALLQIASAISDLKNK